jgi:hypothetical protein
MHAEEHPMSALDRDLAEVLASWANRRRGWDKPGCLAILAKVKHRNADDVAMAWVRFCADPNVDTPGAFPAPSGPHWTERVSPPGVGVQPPRSHEICHLCQRHADRCICRDDEGRPTGPTLTPPRPSEYADDYLETLRAEARRPKERA